MKGHEWRHGPEPAAAAHGQRAAQTVGTSEFLGFTGCTGLKGKLGILGVIVGNFCTVGFRVSGLGYTGRRFDKKRHLSPQTPDISYSQGGEPGRPGSGAGPDRGCMGVGKSSTARHFSFKHTDFLQNSALLNFGSGRGLGVWAGAGRAARAGQKFKRAHFGVFRPRKAQNARG